MAEFALGQKQMIVTSLDMNIVVVLITLRKLVENYKGDHNVVLSMVVGVVAHTPMVELNLVLMQPQLQRSPHLLFLHHLQLRQSPPQVLVLVERR